MAQLEHVNITVKDPRATAALLNDVFGWTTRWEGPAMGGAGYSVHVGADETYIALYSGSGGLSVPGTDASYTTQGGMNHIGIVVDDLDAAEAALNRNGFTAHSHADYAPGRRFYFHDADGVEIEVVSYT